MIENHHQAEVLRVTRRLLDAIATADWATYEELCDSTLTCFEPESMVQLVEGLAFHEFYFKLGAGSRARNTTISSPHVRIVGDVAIVSYARIDQKVAADGSPYSRVFEETRIWQRREGTWKHIHFHRSAPLYEGSMSK